MPRAKPSFFSSLSAIATIPYRPDRSFRILFSTALPRFFFSLVIAAILLPALRIMLGAKAWTLIQLLISVICSGSNADRISQLSIFCSVFALLASVLVLAFGQYGAAKYQRYQARYVDLVAALLYSSIPIMAIMLIECLYLAFLYEHPAQTLMTPNQVQTISVGGTNKSIVPLFLTVLYVFASFTSFYLWSRATKLLLGASSLFTICSILFAISVPATIICLILVIIGISSGVLRSSSANDLEHISDSLKSTTENE